MTLTIKLPKKPLVLLITLNSKLFDMTNTNNKLDLRFHWPIITKELEKVVLDQLHTSVSIYNKSGIFKEFEDNFAQYHNAQYACLFNSGTSAIHAMIEGLDLDPDDEIICPVYTFFATCSPIPYLGYKIVFCDCDSKGNIDPKAIESKITTKTKVVIITHMWGNPCQMDVILDICNSKNLILLEDCSHAHGAKYKNKLVGTFGKIAAWSLQGQKIITGGEGGIMITNDSNVYYRANLLGHYNKRCKDEIPKDNPLSKYSTTGFGLKLRAHPIAIAMANEQFGHLDQWLVQKEIFVQKIKLSLAHIPFLEFLDTVDSSPSYYGLIIKFNSSKANGYTREDFVDNLHAKGLSEVDIPNSTSPLDAMAWFESPELSSKRLLRSTNHQKSVKYEYPNAYGFYSSIIKIPIWVRSQDEIIVDAYIKGFVDVSNFILNPNTSTINLLSQYKLKFPQENNYLNSLEQFLAKTSVENQMVRSNLGGHITSSAFLINRTTQQVLLIKHLTLGVYLQAGGHCELEDKGNWLESAKRELIEETGIIDFEYLPINNDNLQVPFDIDIHTIPNNQTKNEPEHIHYDVRYIFATDDIYCNPIEGESQELVWINYQEFQSMPRFQKVASKISSFFDKIKGLH